MGLSISPKIIDFFYERPKTIRDEDYAMYAPDLQKEIRRFGLSFYGTEPDGQQIKEMLNLIVRKVNDLSTQEVKYVLQQIASGETLVKNYKFNTADILQELTRFVIKKKQVKRAFFQAKKEEEQGEIDKHLSHNFTQGALEKYSNGKHLTVYEKSAVGRHFAGTMPGDQLEQITQMAKEQLPHKQKELGKIRKIGLMDITVDPEMNTPIMWTEDLLRNNMIFETIENRR